MSSQTVYEALNNVRIEDNSVYMLEELEPAVWKKYAKKMKDLGGIWHKKDQRHDFTRNPNMLLDRLKELGSENFNKYSLYTTPKAVFDFLWDEYLERYFYSEKTIRILEPSVGCASLVMQILAKIHGSEDYKTKVEFVCYEIDPINVEYCRTNGIEVTQADFLTVEPCGSFDLVIMNPPFSELTFAKHIEHARKFLTPTGKLFSIVPAIYFSEKIQIDTLLNPNSSLRRVYQAALKSNWSFCQDQLPYNAFKGAKVRTTVLEIDNEELTRLAQSNDESADADLLFLANTNEEALSSILKQALINADNEDRGVTVLDFQTEFVKHLFVSNSNECSLVHHKNIELPNLDFWAVPQKEVQIILHKRLPMHFDAPAQTTPKTETNFLRHAPTGDQVAFSF